jgi:ribosomal protein S18 acetylase RimI-like enzyme
MTSFSVRPWNLLDLPAIRSLIWRSWLATYSGFIPKIDLRTYLDANYSLKALETLFKNPLVSGFVATREEILCGYARMLINPDEERFYLSSLYLLPEYEGQGLGKLFFQTTLKEAGCHGFDALWLGVMVQNVRALAWYRKLGFDFSDVLPFTMGETTVNYLLGCLKIG